MDLLLTYIQEVTQDSINVSVPIDYIWKGISLIGTAFGLLISAIVYMFFQIRKDSRKFTQQLLDNSITITSVTKDNTAALDRLSEGIEKMPQTIELILKSHR